MSAAPLLASVEQLGILVDEEIAADDPKATLLLQVASGIVRERVNRYISRVVDDLEQLDPINGFKAFVHELPLESVSLVEICRDGSTWAAVDASRYRVNQKTGSITAGFGSYMGWPSDAGSWRVTYTHGWAEIPDAISGAVLGLVSRQWEVPIGVENERVGQRSIKYLMLNDGFSAEELVGLDRLELGNI